MNQLVEEARRELDVETTPRVISWQVGDLPEVRGDRALLKQVWINLISNALKYARPRARAEIRIDAIAHAGETEFFVQDNGVGFDMEFADKLFNVFQRLHASDEFEGTGIGLANVRRVISRHGGRTWAKGEVDRGASFHFTLPASG